MLIDGNKNFMGIGNKYQNLPLDDGYVYSMLLITFSILICSIIIFQKSI